MTFPVSQLHRLPAPVLVSLCLCALVPGCVLHEVETNPQPAVSAEGGSAPKNEAGAERNRKPEKIRPWWEDFGDRKLSALIETSLSGNPDLRAAEERIRQAQSRFVQAGSSLFPQISGEGSIGRNWDRQGDREDSATLGGLLDWELDVWGRIRSGRAAREREAGAALEDWRASRLLLTGAVAETWFALLEQRGQLELAGDQIEVNERLLGLIRVRFGQGQGSIVDVLQQKEQLESTLSLVPDIESRVEELSLALDALLGQMPGSKEHFPSERELPAPPPWPKTGVPADLLAKRPDLRAQRERIVALDHEVAEAIADRLPRVSIAGSIAAAGTPSLERAIGDAILGAAGPIFDAGSRKAEVDRRRSRVREELETYSAQFLDAVREVETALVRERKLNEKVGRQESQLATARRLLTESRNRYSLGASEYLPVLDALTKVQELERDLMTSRQERLSARVALHRALGGPIPDIASAD